MPNHRSFSIFVFWSPHTLNISFQTAFIDLAQIYTAFIFLDGEKDIDAQIQQQRQIFQLSKRIMIFVLLNPDAKQLELLKSKGYQINQIQIVKTRELGTNNTIVVQEQKIKEISQVQTIKKKVIKKLKLDFLWVGLMFRLGIDIDKLVLSLRDKQNFQQFSLKSTNKFLTSLNQLLQTNTLQQSLKNLNQLQGQQKKDKIISSQQFQNIEIQQLIEQKFSSRVLLTEVTSDLYLSLLESRNYFHLVYIQQNLLSRYNYFRSKISSKYPFIEQCLSTQPLQQFIMIDQYFYSTKIFKALSQVNLFIDRLHSKQNYSSLLQSHHQEIIRLFRPDIDEYFLALCRVLKKQSACLKEAVGAILIRDKFIVATGYNGTAAGTKNCHQGGCAVCNNSQMIGTEVLSCSCIHAEYACIMNAGLELTPATTLYSTKLPCLWCVKLLVQAKIKEVVYQENKYPALIDKNQKNIKETLSKAKIGLRKIN